MSSKNKKAAVKKRVEKRRAAETKKAAKSTKSTGKIYEDTSGNVFKTHAEAAASNTRMGTNPSVNKGASNAKDLEKSIDDVMESLLGSGYGINPGLTAEDIAAIDPKNFLSQAEAMIASEYKQKFAVATDALKRAFSQSQEDYLSDEADINRLTEKNTLTGREDLAERGLAFSGRNEQFLSDTASARTRALDLAARSAQRTSQDALLQAEGLIGTSGLKDAGYSNPSIAGRSLALTSIPIVGSYNTERTYTKESIARELAGQEAQRRAYATRSLSFS